MRLSALLPASLLTRGAMTRVLAARAGAMRDEGRFAEAAVLYQEVLRLRPRRADLHVQCGHMLKEAGRWAEAESHYAEAAVLTPDDPDLALQQGHLFKLMNRVEEAQAAYADALRLHPGWEAARAELESLGRSTASQPTGAERAGTGEPDGSQALIERERRLVAVATSGMPVQEALVPRCPAERLVGHDEGITILRAGRLERTLWGAKRTLRGVEAVRGVCLCTEPVVEVAVLINGHAVHRGDVTGGFVLPDERDRPDRLRKYVFNRWIDFGAYPPGVYALEVRAVDARRRRHAHREDVVIEAPLDEDRYPDLDSLVSIDPDDPRSLDEQVNARPTMVRSARRGVFAQPPRSVLVQRLDQLGDLVVSVPALRRLRAALPAARIVGLMSPANAELAIALNLFDQVLVGDFPEDAEQRRRVMSIERQEELARSLRDFAFDLAIDLSEGAWSRPLLRLSGARMIYGFAAGEEAGLDIDVAGDAHDRRTGHARVPHASKLVGMIDWLAALSRDDATVVVRDQPAEPLLAALGVDPARRFAVLHAGARLRFSRWPHFAALAQALLARTDLDVVMFVDEAEDRDALSPALLADSRFRLMPPQPAFDALDALLSRCSVFVGNDSGPKHLAALRGRPVVSIHSSRINWSEWGQEGDGLILSRKMPCAGCLLHHDPEECGRDFACVRDITAEEVFAAVKQLLDRPAPARAGT